MFNMRRKAFFFPAAVLAVSFLLVSCARKLNFSASPIVPAAEGSVKIKTDKNNNHAIEIKVQHLAPAERLSPPKSTYVVWMVTEKNGTKNIGQLVSSEGFLSNALSGKLSTVTSFEPVRFFITAENDASTQYPAANIVLETKL